MLKFTQLMSGIAGMWTQALRCQTLGHVHTQCSTFALAPKGEAPSGQGPWKPLSTPWGEGNFGDKKEGPGEGGISWGPFQGQGRCHPSWAPWERGRRQLYTAQAVERSWGRKQPLCASRERGAGSLSPRTLCSAQAPRPNLRKPCFFWGGE